MVKLKEDAAQVEVRVAIDIYQRAKEVERTGRLPLRKYGDKRQIMRFTMPRDTFIAAKADIAASGRTLSATVEDGLREYAETGTVRGVAQ